MKKNTSSLLSELPQDFAELNAIHPLRPIADKIDLDNAYEVLNRLAVISKPTKDQRDYLETLIMLTEAFTKEDDDAAMAQARNVSGLSLLKYLMKNTGMKQIDLARLLGVSESAVSLILAGQREITVAHARKLAKRFKLSIEGFLRA